jgi:hypothetical protein
MLRPRVGRYEALARPCVLAWRAARRQIVVGAVVRLKRDRAAEHAEAGRLAGRVEFRATLQMVRGIDDRQN